MPVTEVKANGRTQNDQITQTMHQYQLSHHQHFIKIVQVLCDPSPRACTKRKSV